MRPQDGDENLMANVAQGQRAPLEVLVRRHGSALLTFIRRMVGDPHRSEELFQDVFLAVWSKRLEEGTYAVPFGDGDAERRREITAQELGALLSGIDLSTAKRRKRYRRPGG